MSSDSPRLSRTARRPPPVVRGTPARIRSVTFGAASLALCLALVSLYASCGLADLAGPGEFRELEVEPTELSARAIALREGPQSTMVRISGTGPDAIPWAGATAGGAPWIQIEPTQGETPGQVSVTLDPRDLEPGVHRDTLRFSISEGPSAAVVVPVTLEVSDPAGLECPVRSIDLSEEVGDSLTTLSCESRLGGGRPARRVALDPGDQDSVSVILRTDGFAGHLILEDPAGETLAESDACGAGDVGDVCLLYAAVGSAGTHTIEVSAAAADATGSFSLTAVPPRSPDEPSELVQRDGETGVSLSPGSPLSGSSVVLEARLTDPDFWDHLRLEVEVRPLDRGFTGSSTHVGRAGSDTLQEVRVRDLEAGTAYRWQARARDETGRTGPWLPFGGGSGGPDFVVEAPPDEPEDGDPGDSDDDGDGGDDEDGGDDDPEDEEEEDPGDEEPEPEGDDPDDPEPCEIRNELLDHDVVIVEDQVCRFSNVTISGNLDMLAGARLVATDLDLSGNLSARGAEELEVTDSRIEGNLRFDDGGDARIRGSVLDGNVRLRDNRGEIVLEGNRINGNVQIDGNQGGPFTITDNEIDGNLDCKNNEPPPVGSGNEVDGNAKGQCEDL